VLYKDVSNHIILKLYLITTSKLCLSLVCANENFTRAATQV